jgi:hypothetical protein
MRQCELVDMTKTLERTRIEDSSLVGIESDENVDSITDFVDVFCHCGPLSSFQTAEPLSASFPA